VRKRMAFSTLRHMTVATTRPRAQTHAIFNIALHNSNNNKVLCASACHFNIALHDGDDDNKKMAATMPFVNYEPLVQ
jgi:hypothetical protein